MKQAPVDAYRQAQDWETARVTMIQVSERRAWLVARSSLLITGLALMALAVLLPLKATVPYLVVVDRASGNSEVVQVGTPRTLGQDMLQDKHWVTQYVRSRERYLWNLLQYDYDTVLLLSDEHVGSHYAKQFEGASAIDHRLGSATEYRVTVLSVTLTPGESGHATVRFSREVTRNNVAIAPEARYVATLSYSYLPQTFARERDVIENPLGFKVNAYTVDTEMAGLPVTSDSARSEALR